MKKQILLVVLMACAACAWAVTFPNSGYQNGGTSNNNSNTGTAIGGTTIVNSSTVGSFDGSCAYDENALPPGVSIYDACTQCCQPYFVECLTAGNPANYCGQYVQTPCVTQCQNDSEALGDSPLDASVWMLLAMVAAYGAYAYYQKRQTA